MIKQIKFEEVTDEKIISSLYTSYAENHKNSDAPVKEDHVIYKIYGHNSNNMVLFLILNRKNDDAYLFTTIFANAGFIGKFGKKAFLLSLPLMAYDVQNQVTCPISLQSLSSPHKYYVLRLRDVYYHFVNTRNFAPLTHYTSTCLKSYHRLKI
jgi:hypothetical protein